MGNQSHYHGPQKEDKHLATHGQIKDLQQQIDEFSGGSEGMICWPQSAEGAKLNNSGGSTSFALTHPAMNCKDVCIYDNSLNQWVAAQVNDISTTQTQIVFGSVPQSNRYCVFIRGVPIDASPI